MRFSRPLYLSSYYVERPAVYTDKRKTFSKNWIFKFNRIFLFFPPQIFWKEISRSWLFFYFIVTIPPSSNYFLFRLKKKRKNTAGLTSFFDYLKKNLFVLFPLFLRKGKNHTCMADIIWLPKKHIFIISPMCAAALHFSERNPSNPQIKKRVGCYGNPYIHWFGQWVKAKNGFCVS
jgi:hypothetical protein